VTNLRLWQNSTVKVSHMRRTLCSDEHPGNASRHVAVSHASRSCSEDSLVPQQCNRISHRHSHTCCTSSDSSSSISRVTTRRCSALRACEGGEEGEGGPGLGEERARSSDDTSGGSMCVMVCVRV
jgi:hypothetical protein